MKILLISNMYPSTDYPYYGTFVKNFEVQLLNNGFQFEKAVIKGKSHNKKEKITKYFNFFKNVIKLIKKNNYDIIYVHYLAHSLLPLLFVKKFIKKPLILNAHGSDIISESITGNIIKKIVTPIIKSSNLIVVPSHYYKKQVENFFLLDENRVFISPSGGIDIEQFKPMSNINEIFTIGYVSRIDEGKGWNILLDSLYILKNKNLKFKVIIIGSGTQEKLLLEKINNLKLYKIVEYIGSKPHGELPTYFNKMDLFVFPTIRKAESLGLVGLEAMACGVPVVGSDIGGLPSYIINGRNGKLFETGNIKELVDCVEEFILMNPSKFKNYKREALRTSRLYDSKLVANQLSSRLRELKNEY